MQALAQIDAVTGFPVDRPAAHYLRRVDPSAARCFAEAMYEGAAWANEAWGAYWAAVVCLV